MTLRRLVSIGLALMALSLPLSACHVHGHGRGHGLGHGLGHVPPGQAKKAY